MVTFFQNHFITFISSKKSNITYHESEKELKTYNRSMCNLMWLLLSAKFTINISKDIEEIMPCKTTDDDHTGVDIIIN